MNCGWRVLVAALLAWTTASIAAEDDASEQRLRLVDAPGRDLTAARCSICHSVDYIQMNAPVMDQAGWERSIQKMVERFGAPIDAAEAREIAGYLSAHYSHRSGTR